MRITEFAIITVLMLSIVLPLTHALGLSYPYMENKTYTVPQGSSSYFKLILQNDEDHDLDVEVKLESDIAQMIGEPRANLRSKTYDSYVYFNITPPSDAPVDSRFTVAYSVTPVERGEGQVPFAVAFDRSFTVLVVEPAAEPAEVPTDLVPRPVSPMPMRIIVGVVSVILLIAVILFLWRRSKRAVGK
jgi:hypothetical protein